MVKTSTMPRKKPTIQWAKGFELSSPGETQSALGNFPSVSAAETRSSFQPTPKQWPTMGPDAICLDDLNVKSLYENQNDVNKTATNKRMKVNKSTLWGALPSPTNENDWLAQYAEEGQSFDEFISQITMRSGKFKTSHFGGNRAVKEMQHIALVPIIRTANIKEEGIWPSDGPELELLREFCEVYFNRCVKLLSPAMVSLMSEKVSNPGACFKNRLEWFHSLTGKNNITQIRVATKSAGPSPDSPTINPQDDQFRPRMQILVDPLLHQLSIIKNHADCKDCFCVMGITLEDVYSAPSDLFVAGMAAGGSNVAVFSFHRYHPRLKMSPEHWHDFGFVNKVSDYSYFEDLPKKRPSTQPRPCDNQTITCSSQNNKKTSSSSSSSSSSSKLKDDSASVWLLRAAKLMVHELMHLYGIDHCKYYKCIMNGTGHLVEDFASPMHLCPIDLRKMQWRLAFSVLNREKLLLQMYQKHGWKEETLWALKRIASIENDPKLASMIICVDDDDDDDVSATEVVTVVDEDVPKKRRKK